MHNVRLYVIPRNATDVNDIGDLNSLLDGLDGGTGDPGTNDNPPAGDEDPEEAKRKADEAAAAAAATGDEPPAGDDPPQDQQQQGQQDKAHLAFVQMRTQNATLMKTLKTFAANNGIEYKDETDLLSKIQDQDLSKRAEEAKVPKEVLERMERLEKRDQEYSKEQLKTKALIGFQKVKDTYQLTPAELQEFGDKLFDSGNNPFETDLELEKEYRNMYFDKIVQKRVDAAVEEALKRDSAARKNGSNPNEKRGAGSQAGKEVSTVGDLNALLDSLNPAK